MPALGAWGAALHVDDDVTRNPPPAHRTAPRPWGGPHASLQRASQRPWMSGQRPLLDISRQVSDLGKSSES